MRPGTCSARIVLSVLLALGFAHAGPARSASAPDWMHALVGVAVPPHDDKADAIELYSATQLRVDSDGRMTRVVRRAYLILRPDGERWGNVRADFDEQSPI